ncbi:MAG: sodium/proline symporter [Eubacteriales bacterium]|nr:sodium/proline symporter [Eubacteriales bacterium]
MLADQVQHLIAIVAYMAVVIAIGVVFAKRANKDTESYFLGGRTLGPWVSAFSAEASDMSGWLLMGLPGLAYWSGLASAGWTAIGLAIGTYLNWLIVSKRLRRYSVAVDAITIPDFFSRRFHEDKRVLMTIASVMIIVFFTPYAGSCLMACGKLFSQLFGTDYSTMVIIAALFVLTYTFLGGFLAESTSDFMQGVVMILALVLVVVLGIGAAGGLSTVIENANGIPGFLSLVTSANPTGEAANGTALFGEASKYTGLAIASAMAWGLGYFGMPQVLLRFMGIRAEHELTRSRRIATTWVIISLFTAVAIGLIGRVLYSDAYMVYGSGNTENIFILMSTKLLPPLLAGLVSAGILAAAISSSDSYLLISASAVSKNVWQGLIRKSASEKETMWVSRIVLVLITIFAIFVATGKNQVIFSIVDFAWAGFGAAFGPLMLFSLFWKRTTYAGAIAGMIAGGGMVFLWNFVISTLGGVWGIYELLPAFLFSCIVIVVVSLLTKKPSEAIQKEFDSVSKKVA